MHRFFPKWILSTMLLTGSASAADLIPKEIMLWRNGDFATKNLQSYLASVTEQEFIDLTVAMALNDEIIQVDRITDLRLYLSELSDYAHKLYGLTLNQLSPQKLISLCDLSRPHFDFHLIDIKRMKRPPQIDGCGYNSSARFECSMTEQNSYHFQGHIAIYFRVDGAADCYKKICGVGTFGANCGDGSIPYWDLQCRTQNCSWYEFGGKYMKDVVMLVPSRWWWYYWWVSASEKASWFSVFWRYDHPSQCCDPGCGR